VIDGEHAAIVPGYADVGELLAAGDAGITAASRVDEFEPLRPGQLMLPILRPSAVVCVGLNYRSHILEMGRELPEYPTLFAKLQSALVHPEEAVRLPDVSNEVDYEGEVGVVIGRVCRNVSAADAWPLIAGFTLINDVSARDMQYRTLQWFTGKNLERSTPLGPWMVTTDDVKDAAEIDLRVKVNGEVRQEAVLGDLVFSPPELVAYISRLFTLHPGDIIASGTPGGVGSSLEPKSYLQDGDVVEVSSSAIGTLRTTFLR
jgi:acylpyruvate hydrolase